ncbi:AAA domain-containing protein [Photobacterium halotolerans]|uniref:AAA domain-containing protein n=1 Tax=Photobacterium halotolerans TaxID=265726 RepID=UPI0004824E66|nr:AAA domain-containing protein [Photobacterium halotolerans]
MVSISVNGDDKTSQISDWKIWWGEHGGELMLTCYFPSGKSYSRPLSNCKIEPTEIVQGQLLSKDGGKSFSAVDRMEIYGGKYAAIQYRGSQKIYVMNVNGISFSPETTMKNESVFNYFVRVANSRVDRAKPKDKPIAENVLRQLKAALPHEDTALHAYCTGQNRARKQAINFIYPFGVNESQLKAVEQAFTSQISLIEGPPGTGKTQTILNIIANIVLRGNTVAILSNNNSAVENVYEKLDKAGLGYLFAKLGSADNREDFFGNLPAMPSDPPALAPSVEQIQAVLQTLKLHLHAQNEVARLQAEIDELTIEHRYLLQWYRENIKVGPVSLDKYRLSPLKSLDLMAYLAHLSENRIRFKDRIELLFNFKILRTNPFNDWEKRKSVIYALQLHYYEKVLRDKESELVTYREVLEHGNFKAQLDDLVAGSMLYLKSYLHQHLPAQNAFGSNSYRNKFDEFVQRFPIIGSSTHSIINSIGKGAILDYVIIDEASQQDIVPGVLALGCARNLIIVGDRKQLPHIPTKQAIVPPAEFYDCEKYSLLDSCVGVFNDSIPMTLLKEHYRCHPRIIQFCNQQFYDNQLIPMTKDAGEKSLKLLVTAKGNHTRDNSNRRELDSLLETLKWDGESGWDDENSRGFIAPYNAQIRLSCTHLPADFVKDTVHKFQGRECDEIVFSTVLDKKGSQRSLSFVDDPFMVNVAVSRAKNTFTLVTGDDVFSANNGHIAALVRYIEYYADEKQIHRAPVVSAFDLLYKEYDQSLERLNARLRSSDSQYKSEQIVAQILRDVLSREAYRAMTFHSQIALIQLASLANEALTPRERDFMRNRASCDFVFYFKVGKMPLAVIEVDGGYHDTARQAERDALKNSILRKSEIPLLRLRTVESHIEVKVEEFLARWASGVSSFEGNGW